MGLLRGAPSLFFGNTLKNYKLLCEFEFIINNAPFTRRATRNYSGQKRFLGIRALR